MRPGMKMAIASSITLEVMTVLLLDRVAEERRPRHHLLGHPLHPLLRASSVQAMISSALTSSGG